MRGQGADAHRKHVTLADVAREAGVHRTTASRALNEATQTLVNAGTVARVRAAADKLGYVADPVAQALRGGSSGHVAVLVRTLRQPWVGEFVRGVDTALGLAGFFPWVSYTGDDPERVRRLVGQMTAWRSEGLIIATARVPNEVIVEAAGTGTPVVVVTRPVPDQVCSVIDADNEGGARAALNHLIELGHTRIAYIAGPVEIPVLNARLRGFRDAIEDSGISSGDWLIKIADGYSVEAGEAACAGLLASGRPLTAIAAGNDYIAAGCYVALRKAGLRCPEDVSVIGYDDIPMSGLLTPSLSTMHYPGYEMGLEAAGLILAQMNEKVATRTVLLRSQLLARGSTARPPS
jgi:LacI family transcriptional regulator